MSDHTPHWKISQALEVTEELYQACQRLEPQLTSNNPPPTRQNIALLLSTGSAVLYLAFSQTPMAAGGGGYLDDLGFY